MKVLVLFAAPSCTPSAIGWLPWARFTNGSMMPVVNALMSPLKASATTRPTATTTMSPRKRKLLNPLIAPPRGAPPRARRLRALRHIVLREPRVRPICSSRPQGPGRQGRDGRLPVKVVVDFDVCSSNAVCMGIAPEVFEVRDDGFLYVLDENPGPELYEQVRQAANGCPTGAITIVEDE